MMRQEGNIPPMHYSEAQSKYNNEFHAALMKEILDTDIRMISEGPQNFVYALQYGNTTSFYWISSGLVGIDDVHHLDLPADLYVMASFSEEFVEYDEIMGHNIIDIPGVSLQDPEVLAKVAVVSILHHAKRDFRTPYPTDRSSINSITLRF